MYLIPILIESGYAGGCYDHQGNFGIVIFGAENLELLRKKAEELGYVLRNP